MISQRKDHPQITQITQISFSGWIGPVTKGNHCINQNVFCSLVARNTPILHYSAFKDSRTACPTKTKLHIVDRSSRPHKRGALPARTWAKSEGREQSAWCVVDLA